jgi:hypothetical protein
MDTSAAHNPHRMTQILAVEKRKQQATTRQKKRNKISLFSEPRS